MPGDYGGLPLTLLRNCQGFAWSLQFGPKWLGYGRAGELKPEFTGHSNVAVISTHYVLLAAACVVGVLRSRTAKP